MLCRLFDHIKYLFLITFVMHPSFGSHLEKYFSRVGLINHCQKINTENNFYWIS